MKIPVLHLEDGFHNFNFLIKAKALGFKGNEVYPDNLTVDVGINKFDKNIQCKIDIKTKSYYTCDRCLEGFYKPYHEKFELLFHIGTNDFETDEEDVVFILPETLEIDLSERLIEYLILTIPMKNLCRSDCKGFCPGCGADLNHETCRCIQTAADPRWEELRKLLK